MRLKNFLNLWKLNLKIISKHRENYLNWRELNWDKVRPVKWSTQDIIQESTE